MELFKTLILNLSLIMAIMLALWLVSLKIKNASIVDIFWGIGFVIIAWSTFWIGSPATTRGLMVSLLTTVWGLRLAGYLTWRNVGKGEDYRYREMRDKHGSQFPLISLLTVFWLQAVIMWLVSFPIQAAQYGTTPIRWIDALGLLMWGIGWTFETVGDWQLARFKARPETRGQVMDRGLWRYTRHPNYFGDFLVWWGFYLIATAAGAWWTVFSPLLMSLLLMRVSGVKLLESSLTRKRPGYEQYAARTNAFFPWIPK